MSPIITPPFSPGVKHVVLPDGWQSPHGGERTAGVDEILLPDLSVHTSHGAVRQDNTKGANMKNT